MEGTVQRIQMRWGGPGIQRQLGSPKTELKWDCGHWLKARVWPSPRRGYTQLKHGGGKGPG